VIQCRAKSLRDSRIRAFSQPYTSIIATRMVYLICMGITPNFDMSFVRMQ
jgi:hypothetical protein